MKQRFKMRILAVSIASIFLVIALMVILLCKGTFAKPMPSMPSTESTGEATVEMQKPETPSKPEDTKPVESEPSETNPQETTSATDPENNNGNGSGNGSNNQPESHMHSYTESVVSAACTTGGYTLHKCSCGASYKSNETSELGHNYNTKTISPTTGSGGYDLHTCSNCGNQYKDNYTDPLPNPTEPEQTEPTNPTEPDETYPDDTEKIEYCPDCGLRLKSETFPYGCFKFSSDIECECGKLIRAGECHNHDTGGGYTGGGGTPETEDYGFCLVCGIRLCTSWYPQGCFTYLVDTVCECGVLVHAMECHYHKDGKGFFPTRSEETEPTVPEETEPTEPEETEDYGFCLDCGRRNQTSWYPEGCFYYAVDTLCECGELVKAFACHHH